MRNIFKICRKPKTVKSGVYIKEIDFSTAKLPASSEFVSLIVPGLSDKGPKSEPILITPRIKPVKWYQIWRYKDKVKYKKEVERCMSEIKRIFGESTERVLGEPTPSDTETVIWKKFCDTQYHIDFFKWLMENYEIKKKEI